MLWDRKSVIWTKQQLTLQSWILTLDFNLSMLSSIKHCFKYNCESLVLFSFDMKQCDDIALLFHCVSYIVSLCYFPMAYTPYIIPLLICDNTIIDHMTSEGKPSSWAIAQVGSLAWYNSFIIHTWLCVQTLPAYNLIIPLPIYNGSR